jgi:apolipoprotein N-acyltransferase
MIHYGGLPAPLAYLLLIPGALIVGLFPGLFALVLAVVLKRWSSWAVLIAPAIWAACEWARLGITGQLWNALGYSFAFHRMLIQPANWGGVYAVSFLIVTINAVIALMLLKRDWWTVLAAGVITYAVFITILYAPLSPIQRDFNSDEVHSSVDVIALQPNVSMTLQKTPAELNAFRERHLALSKQALANLPSETHRRLVIWPESPMNFTYASDKTFQEWVANFARDNRTSLIFNSLEPAGPDAYYNSALLINEDGRMIAQYDKIRLMPFGEYVPLPNWLPGASLITGLVGEFTPGHNYTLMPVNNHQVGVFICIESAYPSIARQMTREGADVLINISNDGYLGPTGVMRQHLANAIFRAVENGRPVLRVTNSGVSAEIGDNGRIWEQTMPFQEDVRHWSLGKPQIESTFYTRHGDLFVQLCAAISVIVLAAAWFSHGRSLS